jgi:hypothetical protein
MSTQTTNKAKLAEQIAKLTAEYELQTLVESKLPGIEKIYTNDFNYKSHDTKYTFTVHLTEIPLAEIPAKIQEVITAFPPTRNNVLTFTGKDDQQTESPFVLSWKNNIRDNKVQIQYNSGDFWAHIELPVKFYSDDVKGGFMRKVYDTEHHYFGGTSMKQIENMQIRSYKLDMFESVKYYGGDVTNYINHSDDKEEFESVVLKGHTPQFADFWAKQLETI